MFKFGATKIYCDVDVNGSQAGLLGINSALTNYVFVAVTKVVEYFSKKFILEGNFIKRKSMIKN